MLEEYRLELAKRIQCIDLCYSIVLKETSTFLAFIKQQSNNTLSNLVSKKQELTRLLQSTSILKQYPLPPIFKLNPTTKIDTHQVSAYYKQEFYEEKKQLDYTSLDEACRAFEKEFNFFSLGEHIAGAAKKLLLGNNDNLISAFPDHSLRVISQESCCTKKVLKGHTGIIHILTFTPDEKYLISASYDRTIILWSLPDFVREFTFEGHNACIRDLTVTSDSKYIVSGGWDRTLIIWNISKKKKKAVLSGHKDFIESIAVSKDSRFIVSAGYDHQIKLWNFRKATEKCSLSGHTDTIFKLIITSDSKSIISAGRDLIIRIWSIRKKTLKYSLSAHTLPIFYLLLTSDNKYLASAGDDTSICFWNLTSRAIIYTFSGHHSYISLMIFNHSETSIISISGSTIKIWELISGLMSHTIKRYATINSIALTRNDSTILYSDSTNYMHSVNLDTCNRIEIAAKAGYVVISLTISLDNQYAFIVTKDPYFIIWNLKKKDQDMITQCNLQWRFHIVVTRDNKYVVYAEQSMLYVWNLRKFKEKYRVINSSYIRHLIVTYDSRYAIVFCDDHIVSVYDIKLKHENARITGPFRMISQITVVGQYTDRRENHDNIIKRWDNNKLAYQSIAKNIKISSSIAYRGLNKYIIGATDEDLYFVWKFPLARGSQT